MLLIGTHWWAMLSALVRPKCGQSEPVIPFAYPFVARMWHDPGGDQLTS
jgi:hypothetical protein